MTLPDESLRAMTSLAGIVLGQSDLTSALQEVTRISVRAVTGADGASVTSFADGRPVVAAASDDWSAALDALQYTEHEGPCLDCARVGALFRVRDLAEEVRWPSYAPRAAALGARSVLSLPMSAEGRIMGALNVYSRTPDAFSPQAVSVGEVVAAHSGLAMQVASAFYEHRDLADQLRLAMDSRAVIEQAKGIVMATSHCTADEAFTRLVDLSQRSNRKLRDVADVLVRDAAGERV